MAEESFIILENTQSLMEPYSFLEMPDSVSLQSYNAATAAPPSPPRTTKNDPATTNGTSNEIDVWSKSVWSTQALTDSTNTVVTTANTQTYTTSVTNDTPIHLSTEPVSINKPCLDTSLTDSILPNENKEIEKDKNGGQHLETTATPYSFISMDILSLKSTNGASIEASADKKSITNTLSTTPKDKLAESFLLGNIDFETMKVGGEINLILMRDTNIRECVYASTIIIV